MSNPSQRRRGAARGWPPDVVDLLERLWKAGDLSASQIAERLGVSRNAVLGKVFRLGLSGQRAPASLRPARPSPRPRRRSSPSVGRRRTPSRAASQADPQPGGRGPSDSAAPATAAEDEPGLVAHLEDLASDACHWPCGDPQQPDFAFCGRRTVSPPYCPAHDRRAHRKGAGASFSQLLKLAARSS